jgi:hypothetical protein
MLRVSTPWERFRRLTVVNVGIMHNGTFSCVDVVDLRPPLLYAQDWFRSTLFHCSQAASNSLILTSFLVRMSNPDSWQ